MNSPLEAIPMPTPLELAQRFRVLQAPHPGLREAARPIGDFLNDTWDRLADGMLVLVKEKKGTGLSANQIGVSARLIVASFDGRSLKMANPEIIAGSGEQRNNEGCLSVQRGHFRAWVVRKRFIRFRYQDPANGDWKLGKAKDFMAAIIQHEIDHLDGILFTDKVKLTAIDKAMAEAPQQGSET